MSFHIRVHLESDDDFFRSSPDDAPAFNIWLAECKRRELYSKPLGANDIIFRFWNSPARENGLTLIGSIYYNGLRVRGEQLGLLDAELMRLKSLWEKMDLEDEPPLTQMRLDGGKLLDDGTQPLRDDLFERAGFLAAAIETAQSRGGILVIS